MISQFNNRQAIECKPIPNLLTLCILILLQNMQVILYFINNSLAIPSQTNASMRWTLLFHLFHKENFVSIGPD